MDVDRSYIERNSSSLRRLRAVIGGLHDDDFNRDAGGGWTIGAVVAHVAFWDRYVTTRLSRWEKQGFESAPLDPDSINDAALPGWRAIPADSRRPKRWPRLRNAMPAPLAWPKC